jgi:hypothetical protein
VSKRRQRSPNWASYTTKSHPQEALKVFSKQFLEEVFSETQLQVSKPTSLDRLGYPVLAVGAQPPHYPNAVAFTFVVLLPSQASLWTIRRALLLNVTNLLALPL